MKRKEEIFYYLIMFVISPIAIFSSYMFMSILMDMKNEPEETNNNVIKSANTDSFSISVSKEVWMDNIPKRNDKKPNEKYLLISICIINKKEEKLNIPNIYLLENNGDKYHESNNKVLINDFFVANQKINSLSSLNGNLLFDINPNGEYSLIISEGFWPSENTEIHIGAE